MSRESAGGAAERIKGVNAGEKQKNSDAVILHTDPDLYRDELGRE